MKSILFRVKPSFLQMLVGALFMVLFNCSVAQAQSPAEIRFEATDLVDITAGQDLWRYNYFVSGFNFQQDQGFSIFLIKHCSTI